MHEANKHGLQPYKCKHCESTFGSNEEKREHESAEHGVEMPYKCPVCDLYYRTDPLLQAHVTEAHSSAASCCTTSAYIFMTIGKGGFYTAFQRLFKCLLMVVNQRFKGLFNDC